jgi:hypothetical protein
MEILTAATVAERLGLGDVHAAWLKNVEQLQPDGGLTVPDREGLSALLGRLGVSDYDAAELPGAMPSPEHNPEAWWLLERCSHLLTSNLANHDTSAAANAGAAAARAAVRSRPTLDWAAWLQSFASPLPPTLRFLAAQLILVSLGGIRDCHEDFGIPSDVSWKTLSMLGRAMTEYRQRHGEAGIRLTPWKWLRFSGWLYEVGRLEVAHYRIRTHPKEAGPLFWYDDETIARLGPGFRLGDPALSIHIPPSDPLTPTAFDDSFHRIRTDFKGIYPGEPMRVATCTSWLLDEQLAEYLPAESNIVAFQKRFNLVPGGRDDDAIVQAVFGRRRPAELDTLPQRTRLERAVVQHLREGRHWRVRTGWLDLSH